MSRLREEKQRKTRSCLLQSAVLGTMAVGICAAASFYSGFSVWSAVVALVLLAAIMAVIWLPFSIRKMWNLPLFAVTAYGSFFLLEFLTHNPWEMEWMPQLLNILVIALLMGLLIGICGRFCTGLRFAIVICMIVGIANYYTMEFRDSPILPWDLLSVQTAMSVTSNYEFAVTWKEANTLLGFLLLLAAAGKSEARCGRVRVRAAAAAACLISIFGVKTLMGMETVTDRVLTFSNLFTQWATYRDNGFFISFMTNLKYMDIKEPEGYSAERADEIVRAGAQEYDAAHAKEEYAAEDEQPNIIVIMNESFSDLAVLHEFGVSEDYMPYLHSMMESDEALTGTLYVSVLGGNTANSEYEFLTGNSMAFLPSGSVAYQQYVNSRIPSMVWDLEEQGYQTFASHPYGASGWDRDEVYPWLGFAESFFRPDFRNPRLIRKYVSDESQYQFLEEKMAEKSEDGPVFSFHVTMQNHGGYSRVYENFPIQVELTEIEGHEATENYLTLIQESDRALQELISFYEETEEPTLIVFFGDHQPSDFVANCIQSLGGKETSGMTLEELQRRYQVPYLIWANFDLGEDAHETLSVNYLGALTAEKAGIELSDHQKYLLNLQEKIPVITANVYMDRNGELHEIQDVREEDRELIAEYEIVCYRYLFDAD